MTVSNALDFSSASWTPDVLDREAGIAIVKDLYDRERGPLFRYLSFLGVDAATAEDTVQESFLRLYQHVMGGGDRSNLRAWLYRVGHNFARNTQQAFRNSRTGPLEDSPGLADRRASSVSTEQVLIEREDQLRLAKAVQRLSEAQRSCLVLRAQGFKYREIAEALTLSVSTVAENVQRGLEKLKETL